MAEVLERDTKVKAVRIAKAIGCHVRTVVRAVTGEVNPSDWAPEDVKIGVAAAAFGMKPKDLISVLKGESALITIKEAAALTHGGISIRRFHQMREDGQLPNPALSHGRIVRYIESDFTL